jgi:hypothetical protein
MNLYRPLSIALIPISILAACQTSAHRDQRGMNDSTVAAKPDIDHPGLNEKIIGTWAFVGDENPSFIIGEKTITYPDLDKIYFYSLHVDIMYIQFDGFKRDYMVRMSSADTLMLLGDDEQIYYRFRMPADSSGGATAMLRQFYIAYMTAFNDTSTTDVEKELATLQHSYCTASLLKRIPQLADKIDADPFLQAQDNDSSLAKSLVIKRDPKKPSVYIVSYLDGTPSKAAIHVSVVREKEGYKLADVW